MNEREEATSESIGTIGMVAITVTLAAIILAAFLTSAHSTDPYVLGASAHVVKVGIDAKIIHFTYHGGMSHDELVRLNWTLSNAGGSESFSVIKPEVGYVWESPVFENYQWNPPYHLIVVATFWNDDQQVILDKWLEE